MIDYFNVQTYGEYSIEAYDNIIKNGYPSNKIVFGMLSSQYNKDTFIEAMSIISSIKKNIPNFEEYLFGNILMPHRLIKNQLCGQY